jgi:predicted CXXCH cytochrome family protein
VRKYSFIVILALAAMFLSAGVAYANYGPHGGYATDTDACAGCHRAHTSFSNVGWTDLQGGSRASALLVSNAADMSHFCYACHGNTAPGAATNVEGGLFDSGPTVAYNGTVDPSVGALYASNSSFDATLNGGGFDTIGTADQAVVSSHNMEQNNAPTWGDIVSGVGTPGTISPFRCTDCHDPHGSSNYRLLKDVVNGRTVGGYDKVTPDPYVISNEEGYPTGGWKRGPAGVAQIAAYKPNYTTPQWAQTSGRAMSKWCAACHTAYIIENDDFAPVGGEWGYTASPGTYNYGTAEALVDVNGNHTGPELGALARHRHPIDVPLSLGQGAGRGLNIEVLNDDGLPLEMSLGNLVGGYSNNTKPWSENGNVTCLTCHRAHGTQATQTGWGLAELGPNGAPRPVVESGVNGVNPNFSQALLRFNNRGVCERCHDK